MPDDMSSTPSNLARLEEYRGGGPRGRGPSGTDQSPEIPPQYALTDLANAKRFARMFGEDLKFCGAWNKWLVWDGQCRWEFDETGERYRRGGALAMALYDDMELIADYKARSQFASQSCDNKRMEAMIKLARYEHPIPVRAPDFDRNPFLFNTRSGTVDLLTGDVYPPRREDLLLKYAPVEHDANAECPRWLEMLKTIFDGNEETIKFVQRAVFYSLTGSIDEECMFILYGTGANGKTTFIETIQALVADYGSVAPIELLLKSNKAQTDSERLFAPLTGVRFLSVTEPEQNDRMAMGRIKRMTGGDTLAARYLYGESFKFRPQFKIWLLTNHPPNLNEVGPAVERRLKLIPFTVEIPKEQRDRKLKEYLIANELPGILNWALAGGPAWREKGLGDCPAVSQATARMLAEADVVQRFVSEMCTVGPLERIGSRQLFSEFGMWCKENREYSIKQKEFTARLRALYKFEAPGVVDNTRTWKGIGLKPLGAMKSDERPGHGPTYVKEDDDLPF